MAFQDSLITGPPKEKAKVGIVRRVTGDVLEQAEALPFWSQDYTQLDKGVFAGAVTSVSYQGVQLFRETMNRAVDELANAPANAYVIGLPTAIEGDASWGLLPLSSDSLITLDKNAELLFRTSHLSEITAAVISAERLENYAASVEWVDLTKLMSKIKPVEKLKPIITRELQNTLVGITNHIANMENPDQALMVWRQAEEDLMAICLQALMEASKNPIRGGEQRIHRHIVNRVRELTLSSHGEICTISELCTTLRISRRTLNHAFTRVLGITPVTYIRNLRLQRVREELQTSPFQVTTIADVASRWGFWHMSLFSRYYRELFGECPNETLQRALLMYR